MARERPAVCAVVVTFDRPETLNRCLQLLQQQSRRPDTVLVVDNGSRPAVEPLRELPDLDVRVLRLQDNLGPAGGFAAGIEAALGFDTTHLWLMDDDVRPESRCLERLIYCSEQHNAELVFPEVRNESGTVTNFPGWSAVLLAASAARQAGLPRAEFFWWTEDTEYLQWRIPRLRGVHPNRCTKAIAVHGPARRPRHKPPWKYYYEVRNSVYYRLWIQQGALRRRASRLVVVLAHAFYGAIARERSFETLRFVVLGLSHALRRKLGKTIDPQGSR